MDRMVKSLLCCALLVLSEESRADWMKTGGPPGGPVSAVQPIGGYVFAGTWGLGVFRSVDNGYTWVSMGSGMSSVSAFSFAEKSGYVFAATEEGLYRSGSYGGSWVKLAVSPAADGSRFNCLVSTSTASIAGSDGDGLFRSTHLGAT